jgi:hypothetical protein
LTLIAALVARGDALVGADLLMSIRGFAASFKPPLVSWIGDTRIEALVQKPLCLRQKLILLSDQICIAYSGRQDRAEHILERARKEHISPSQIHDFLHEHLRMYSRSQRRKLSFIVLSITDGTANEQETPFRWTAFNCRYNDLENDKILAGGSGSDLFLQLFKSRASLGVPANRASHLDQYFKFYGAMSLMSGYEFFGGAGILDRSFGGPYEISGISRKKGRVII